VQIAQGLFQAFLSFLKICATDVQKHEGNVQKTFEKFARLVSLFDFLNKKTGVYHASKHARCSPDRVFTKTRKCKRCRCEQ